MGPMIFDEKALKALDEKLGNDLNQNLRASNRSGRSALEVMVEQHGRRMLDTCAAEGNVALTTVEGTAEQSDVTGESAVRAVGSSIFGPFEAGFGSQQDFLITAFGEWLHAAALSVGRYGQADPGTAARAGGRRAGARARIYKRIHVHAGPML